MNQLDVHVDWSGTTARVGTAYFTVRRGALTTRVVYDATWLGRSDAWSISPDLPITVGQATTNGLPGAFADAAPDRWGRNLIDRHHRTLHRDPRGAARTLTDVDYLIGVSDITRQGALRFTEPGGTVHLQPGGDVPKLVSLPTLLDAAGRAAADDDDEAVKVLLDAGTGSLGGARPKASVSDSDRLMIAKFPHPGDPWDVMAWEATALDLAAASGLDTPPHRLVHLGAHAVLLVERFDRAGSERVPYISAMSLVGVTDGSDADYLDVAEAITDHSGRVRHDLRELFRRIAFSLVVNNVDDHLRNHGFLRRGAGWQLAPVFDVNPNAEPSSRRMTSVAGATSRDEACVALIESAEWFDLRPDDAAEVVASVWETTRNWREVAARHGVPTGQLNRFAALLDSPPAGLAT